MIRFLTLLAAGTVVVLGIIIVLPRLGIARPSGEIAWTASLYADKIHIAESRDGPRVLVVGGSSTLFSFDAEMAQQRLGRPVVNFGTHAGLGLAYILDRAARILRPGDVVLLAPEYELLMQTASANAFAIQMTVFYDNTFLSRVPWRDRPSYLLGYDVLPSLLSEARTILHHPPAGRKDITLDPLGDARGNTVALSSGSTLSDANPTLQPVSPEMAARLRAFAEVAATHGAKIYVIPPATISTLAYIAPAFRHFLASLPPFYASMGIEPVGAPDISFLAPADMYDSVYHANDRGRMRYTKRVLDALCRVMVCKS